VSGVVVFFFLISGQRLDSKSFASKQEASNIYVAIIIIYYLSIFNPLVFDCFTSRRLSMQNEGRRRSNQGPLLSWPKREHGTSMRALALHMYVYRRGEKDRPTLSTQHHPSQCNQNIFVPRLGPESGDTWKMFLAFLRPCAELGINP